MLFNQQQDVLLQLLSCIWKWYIILKTIYFSYWSGMFLDEYPNRRMLEREVILISHGWLIAFTSNMYHSLTEQLFECILGHVIGAWDIFRWRTRKDPCLQATNSGKALSDLPERRIQVLDSQFALCSASCCWQGERCVWVSPCAWRSWTEQPSLSYQRPPLLTEMENMFLLAMKEAEWWLCQTMSKWLPRSDRAGPARLVWAGQIIFFFK